MKGLDRLFAPRSIAVIGASADPRKFGGRPLAALKRWRFEGDLHVVNPRHDDIQGVRCTASVADLPAGIDLAVILLPAASVEETLAACAERGVGSAAVFSGGFGESGSQGAARQRRLRELVESSGMRLLGPNGPGFVNLRANVACSASAFAQRDEMFAGQVSFVLQSGAIAGILADRAFDRGIGLNAIVCTGNEVDVDIAEVLEWLAEDPHTDAVGIFVEALGRDTRLVRAMEMARRKGLGIAALHAGRSEEGGRVVASHTAGLVGKAETFDAACVSLGVVRARDYDELLEATYFLATAPRVGRKVAVVGSSGGMNALLADAAAENGVSLPRPSSTTSQKLTEIAPDFGSASNPVDISSVVLVEPERLRDAVRAVGTDPDIDTVVIALGDHPPELSERFAGILLDAAALCPVPLVVQWSAGSLSATGIAALARAGLAVMTEPGRCMRVLAMVSEAVDRPRRTAAVRPIPPFTSALPLSESEAKTLLQRAGVATPRGMTITDPAEAESAARALGDPVVIKADCVGVHHKTEAGAIVLGVHPPDAPRVAARVMRVAQAALGPERVRGVLLEQQLEPVAEVIASVGVDDHAGPLLTVGSGGVLVELVNDTVTRLAPVGVDEALEMISRLRVSDLIEGWRDRPAGDRKAVAELVSRLSEVGAAWGNFVGLIELNPVAVLTTGAVALDAVVEAKGP